MRLEPPFAIGLVGIVPEVPDEDSVKALIEFLVFCPDCGGKGYQVNLNNRGYRCGTCGGVPAAFWIDGCEMYAHRSFLANDAANAYNDAVARDCLSSGMSLAQAWGYGVNWYGFHKWRQKHPFG
jgi:hypothetical protein